MARPSGSSAKRSRAVASRNPLCANIILLKRCAVSHGLGGTDATNLRIATIRRSGWHAFSQAGELVSRPVRKTRARAVSSWKPQKNASRESLPLGSAGGFRHGFMTDNGDDTRSLRRQWRRVSASDRTARRIRLRPAALVCPYTRRVTLQASISTTARMGISMYTRLWFQNRYLFSKHDAALFARAQRTAEQNPRNGRFGGNVNSQQHPLPRGTR